MNVRMKANMILGGGVCGSLVGTSAGALVGVVYGLLAADVSRGLDGALLGGAITACAGAIYGALLRLPDDVHSPPTSATYVARHESLDDSRLQRPIYGPEEVRYPENRHFLM